MTPPIVASRKRVVDGRDAKIQVSTRPRSLDEFVEGLPWSELVTDSFKTRNGFEESPVYFSPRAETGRDLHLGTFINGELHFFPVGFSLSNNDQREPTIYRYTKNRLIKEAKKRKERIYVPLELSDRELTLDGREGIFPMYSVKGAKNDFPLLFVNQTDNGFEYTGLFRDENGEVEMFSYESIESPQWEKMWHQLHDGTYIPNRKSTASNNRTSKNEIEWNKPVSIKTFLDRYVIGQEHAKRTVAVAFSKYQTFARTGNPRLPRAHLLLIGPTAVGKTYMVDLLAKEAGLPFTSTNLTGKASEGYIGTRLADALVTLAEKTERVDPYCIVILNEIDKMARDSWGKSGGGYGSRIQRELMGWIDGDRILLKYGEGSSRRERWIDTSNMFFITTGAFYGNDEEPSIQTIIAQRIQREQAAGRKFGEQPRNNHLREELLTYVRHEDLIVYGLMQELVGRLSGIGALHPLSVDQKVEVLRRSENSILQRYQELFREIGFDLEIDEESFRVIAEAAPEATGVRGLDTVCLELFDQILFDPTLYANGDRVYLNSNLTKALISASSQKRSPLHLV
ncbi:TPA: AAA family ATPase [Candidatus Woesearchaeota archaeon]|nr:AAA family ATPase [Candidatus Woesearchaeota archaeon]